MRPRAQIAAEAEASPEGGQRMLIIELLSDIRDLLSPRILVPAGRCIGCGHAPHKPSECGVGCRCVCDGTGMSMQSKGGER